MNPEYLQRDKENRLHIAAPAGMVKEEFDTLRRKVGDANFQAMIKKILQDKTKK